MTKSTITRERLEEIRDYDTCVTLEESAELARMALAAMDSEPVAWLRNPDQGFHLPMLRLGSKDPNPNFVNEEFYPVYAAPQPAPVVPGKWIPVSEQKPDCWCLTCRPVTLNDMRFVVCPDCGNKRCPRANDHRNACARSNEPGQEGSAYPAAPQEVKP